MYSFVLKKKSVAYFSLYALPISKYQVSSTDYVYIEKIKWKVDRSLYWANILDEKEDRITKFAFFKINWHNNIHYTNSKLISINLRHKIKVYYELNVKNTKEVIT